MKTHALTALAAVALAGSCASAQLVPDRLYFGVDRPVPMTVTVPADAKGDPVVELYAPGAEKPTASAPVSAGSVNLAALFPSLWSEKTTNIQYAQLKVGDAHVGAPVVLQPLLNARPAIGGPGGIEIPPRSGPLSGIRAYPEKFVQFDTTFGTITFKLRPDQAPNTAWNFRALVEGGFYTDIVFHRIIGPSPGKDGFMAQVGDPTGTGGGGPGYNIDLEDSKLQHDFGVLSMARTNDPNTGGSQVFVCFSRGGTSFLDGAYCAFAQAVDGGDAIVQLGAHPTEAKGGREKSSPVDPKPKLTAAKLVDAPPITQQPKAIKAPAPVAPPR